MARSTPGSCRSTWSLPSRLLGVQRQAVRFFPVCAGIFFRRPGLVVRLRLCRAADEPGHLTAGVDEAVAHQLNEEFATLLRWVLAKHFPCLPSQFFRRWRW